LRKAEDFLVLEAEVLGSPTDDGEVEDFIAIEALHILPLMQLLSQIK
jgi:hypothetical protein